jgi:hypothetical protein
MIRTVVPIILLFFVRTAPARAETVAEMLAGCRSVAAAPVTNGSVTLPNNPGVQRCWGAISVLQELSKWVVEGRTLPMFSPCVPADLPRTQWAAVLVSYVDQYPGRLEDEFALVTLIAMGEAYPCRKP